MKKLALWRKFLKTQRGAAAIEFGFIAPIMVVMAAGVWELGRGLQSQTAADELASQYAIAWADCTDLPAGTCSTELNIYTPSNVFANIAPQLTTAKVGLQMFQITMTSGSPTVTYAYPGGASLSAAQTTAAKTSLTNGQSGVVVTVSYNFTLDFFPNALGGIVPSTIPMSFTVVQMKA